MRGLARGFTLCLLTMVCSQASLAKKGFVTWQKPLSLSYNHESWHVLPPSLKAPSGIFQSAESSKLKKKLLGFDLRTLVNRMAYDFSGLENVVYVPRLTPEPLLFLAKKTGTKSETFDPEFMGIPFCDLSVRTHLLNSGELAILGTLPQEPTIFPNERIEDWPDLNESFEQLTSTLSERNGPIQPAKLISEKRCWQSFDSSWRPAWEIRFTVSGLTYSGTADQEQTYRFDERFFSVNGVAQVYRQNSSENELSAVILKDLIGDGTLSGERIKVNVPKNYELAFSENNEFAYSPDDPKFPQPNLYFHAQTQIEFLEKIGYTWPAGKRLIVSPHLNSDAEVGINNALFKPADCTDPISGQIKLGDGDGVSLKNLAIDADVVAHELGHQVIYTTIKKAGSCFESLALHEGLSDFFAFARTGDSCLGETICVEGTDSCSTATCLRSGSLDVVYGDELWNEWSRSNRCYNHRSGQLFSSLLWDMQEPGKILLGDLSKIVFKAVSLLREDSGFRDFLLSLYLADLELFQSSHWDIISEKIKKRGLESFVSELETGKPFPQLKGGGAGKTKTSTDVGSDKIAKKSTCGVIAKTNFYAQDNSILVLLLPLLLFFLRPIKRDR